MKSRKGVMCLCLLLLWIVPLSAQTLSVESFRLLENDLTANTYGSMMYDQNGEVAALIRVVTPEKGFVFDGGMMGIVGTKQDVGEIMVYVPYGIQKITIKHEQLGILRDYYFPVTIEKARTYEMKLLSGRIRTVVEEDLSAQYVTFIVDPHNALVYIDGTAYMPQSDGSVSQLLLYGSHEYRVELPGYKTESGVVQVGSEKVVKEIALQSSKATITIKCDMPEADIYINDEKVGQGEWTGKLSAAMYKIESRREGYQTRLVTITVKEFEERTVSLPAPIPIYGKIQIQSNPFNATVLLDGKEIGETPLLYNDVIVGKHKIVIRKEDYHDYSADIIVEEGKIAKLEAELDNSFTARITSSPGNARVSINGEQKGFSPLNIKMMPGDYTIDVSKRSYNKTQEKVHFSPSSPNYHARLTKKVLSSSDKYFGGGYHYTAISSDYLSDYHFLVGSYWKNINFEADVVYMDEGCKENIIEGYWLVLPEDMNGNVKSDGLNSYRYQAYLNNIYVSAKLGFGIMKGNRLRFTPQCGLAYQILVSEDDYYNEKKKSYILSARFDLRMEYSLIRHVSFYITPEYSLPVRFGQMAEKMNEKDGAVSSLAGGIYVQAGLSLYF